MSDRVVLNLERGESLRCFNLSVQRSTTNVKLNLHRPCLQGREPRTRPSYSRLLTNLMSGLPSRKDPFPGLSDIHMNTAKGYTASSMDIHMATAKGMTLADVSMQTAKVDTTLKKGRFKLWEQELLDSPEVRRKATVAQLCE